MIPDMTISGTSRMLPNEAVLRWPRLGLEYAAKHIYTVYMQTNKNSNTEHDDLQKQNTFHIVMLITSHAEWHAELATFHPCLETAQLKSKQLLI